MENAMEMLLWWEERWVEEVLFKILLFVRKFVYLYTI
jgi:hypothetical protein